MLPKFKPGDVCLITRSSMFPQLVGSHCTILTVEGYFDRGSAIEPSTSIYKYEADRSDYFYMIQLSMPIQTKYGSHMDALCSESRLMKISPDGSQLSEDEFHKELLTDKV